MKNKIGFSLTFLFAVTLTLHSAHAATKAEKAKDSTQPVRSDLKALAEKMEVVKTNSAVVSQVQSGNVDFFALGKPSMLKIHGETAALTGTLSRIGNDLTGELKIPLESFKTGMTTRDNHLKNKVFETAKYQTATLMITSLAVPVGNGEFKDIPFSGKLNLHGVEKEVKGISQITINDKTTHFAAHLDIKLSDYQIERPEFMGMNIQDDVKIDAKGEAKAQL